MNPPIDPTATAAAQMIRRRRSSSRCWTSVMLASLDRRRRPGIRGIDGAARSGGRGLALRWGGRGVALAGGQPAPALLEGLRRGVAVALDLGPEVGRGPAEVAERLADVP